MPHALDRAIRAIADGETPDWEALLLGALDLDERNRIEDLRALSQLSPVDEHAPLAEPAPSRWGHLELIDELGAGSYGVVYRAWDPQLAREVALKVLVGDGGERDRLGEARRLAKVTHPHVVRVYGADLIEGSVGIWMELLKGRTLERLVRELGPLSEQEASGLAIDVCGALAAMHTAGIVHGDVKADNVMREDGGRIVLMDMGASRSAAANGEETVAALAGTPLYMAPELFDGAQPGTSSDVYSAGVLLYRLVTAAFPVHGHTLGDIRRAHAEVRHHPLREARPDLSPEFVAIVDRCLASTPRARFPSVSELERALVGFRSRIQTAGIWPRGRWLWPVLAGAALVGVFLTSAGWYRTAQQVTGGRPSETTSAISPDQYPIYAGYEELAFARRVDDPIESGNATRAARALIRRTMPGHHGVFALLCARLSESWRLAGNLRQSRAEQLDGLTHAALQLGDPHPFGIVLALEAARTAQGEGDHGKAALDAQHALSMRRQLLSGGPTDAYDLPDLAVLERSSRSGARFDDTDGDGLLDALEVTAGLDPRAIDSDQDGVLDEDEDPDFNGRSNRSEFGLTGSPFLTWAHSADLNPRGLGWQMPTQFPMDDGPIMSSGRPAWSMAAGMGFFVARLSPSQSEQAMRRGFSVLVRARPITAQAGVAVDTAPIGPRFDLMLDRIEPHRVRAHLLSSVIPRLGEFVSIEVPAGREWPLLELRYSPSRQSAALWVDGLRVLDNYKGHRQFQSDSEGGVSWGVSVASEADPQARAHFNLVWLEIH